MGKAAALWLLRVADIYYRCAAHTAPPMEGCYSLSQNCVKAAHLCWLLCYGPPCLHHSLLHCFPQVDLGITFLHVTARFTFTLKNLALLPLEYR
jgi:hypothetical protein